MSLKKVLAILITFAFLAILVRTAWISDDALITLRTVLNVTHGFGLTFNVAERVQTFTHPLWMGLLTFAYLVLKNVYTATFVVSMGVSLAAFWLVLTRAVSTWQAVVAAIVLLWSRAFVDYSTSGLENPLTTLLLAVFLGVFLKEGTEPARRLTRLTLLTSLLYLTRPDAVLFVIPLLALAIYQARRPATIVRSLVIGAVPALAWTAFAIVYYGFPFPNTAYAKLATHISRSELWTQGVLYLVDSLDRDPLTITAIGFAIVTGIALKSASSRALATGVVLYLLYTVSIGGDFMAGRFLAVPLYAAALLMSRFGTAPASVWAACAIVFLAIGTASAQVPLFSNSRFGNDDSRRTGIVDERGVYFERQSLTKATRSTFLDPDWPTSVRTDRWNVQQTCGLLGAGGLSGPAVHLLDDCALADPLLARLPAAFNRNWRTGHYRRIVPDGYEESLATNTNALRDAGLRMFYDDLRLITRSPDLMSRARWRAIVRTNFGRNAGLIDVAYYRHHGSLARLDELSEVRADGTPWNAPGIRKLGLPLAVQLDDRPGRRYLDISLDSDDGYVLTFLHRDAIVGELELGPIPEYRRKPGLASFTVDVPARAAKQGFDTIVLLPRVASDHAAVGHLLVDGFSATDPELQRRVAIRDGVTAK